MQDFQNLQEVLRYCEEVLVLDLLGHCVLLDDNYLKTFVNPLPGIYVTGSVEPIISYHDRYYFKSNYPNKVIDNFKEVLKSKEDVLDKNGKVVLSARTIARNQKSLHLEPTVPSVAIKAASTYVQRYLNSLCRHVNRPFSSHRIENLVKEEYQYLIDKDEYTIAFQNLLDEIQRFVNKDTWNIYFYKLKGTSMIVEKGIDWRIYSYYENVFKSRDEE